jgi:hypothetical protein
LVIPVQRQQQQQQQQLLPQQPCHLHLLLG